MKPIVEALQRLGRLIGLMLTLALLASPPLYADDLVAGKDFRTLNPPLAVDAVAGVEVIEFFWYGCNHCYEFEPVLAAWREKLPLDVSLRRMPALFPNNKWVAETRLFHTLEAMDLGQKLHMEVFKAIHEERKRLNDPEVLAEWLKSKGVDSKKFAETMNSFGVQSRVQQTKELTARAAIGAVPAMIVQGKYLALTSGSYGDLLAVVDRLIQRARNEEAKK